MKPRTLFIGFLMTAAFITGAIAWWDLHTTVKAIQRYYDTPCTHSAPLKPLVRRG